MRPTGVREKFKIWRPPDLGNLELRRGTAITEPYPRHWHEEYQLCLVQAGGGEVCYRGDHHPTPAGSLFIIHPGEVHSNQAHDQTGCTFRSLYIDPELFRRAVSDIAGRALGYPFFPVTVVYDADLLARYLRLHLALEFPTASLERQSMLLEYLVTLIRRYASGHPMSRALRQEHRAIKRVREYLTDHYAENISLDELARMANLSPFHLNRLFCAEVGLPPHAYQTQVRIVRAKAFLRQGGPISQVAAQIGFVDQSHLTRHFKRLMGVTPGQYQQSSKNIQDDLMTAR